MVTSAMKMKAEQSKRDWKWGVGRIVDVRLIIKKGIFPVFLSYFPLLPGLF